MIRGIDIKRENSYPLLFHLRQLTLSKRFPVTERITLLSDIRGRAKAAKAKAQKY